MLFGGTGGNAGAEMTGGLPSSLVGNPSMTVLIAAKSEISSEFYSLDL